MLSVSGIAPKSKVSIGKHWQFPISGWNKNVTDYHKKARNFYLAWKSHNKPSYGSICDKIKESCKISN